MNRPWRESAAPVQMASPTEMVEVRCKNVTCRRLLLKTDAVGRIEVVCPDRRCHRYQVHILSRESR